MSKEQARKVKSVIRTLGHDVATHVKLDYPGVHSKGAGEPMRLWFRPTPMVAFELLGRFDASTWTWNPTNLQRHLQRTPAEFDALLADA